MKTYSINNENLMEEIIRSCQICHVGLADEDGNPYVIPMNFGYEDGTIYLHSASEGHSIEIIRKNPRACITFCTKFSLRYQHEKVACSYGMKGESVICRGKIEFTDDLTEKEKALNHIMRQYTNRKFTYSVPALKNVQVWIVNVEEMTGKVFGEKHNMTF